MHLLALCRRRRLDALDRVQDAVPIRSGRGFAILQQLIGTGRSL